MKKISILFFLCMIFACSLQPSKNKPTTHIASNLLVEGLTAPLNVHRQQPSLSWYANIPQQSHYQIQVARTRSALQNNHANLWDSGKIASSQSVNVTYQGEALQAGEQAFWRVKVWPLIHDKTVEWSQIAKWEVGLRQTSNWTAKWIQAATPTTAVITPPVLQWMRFATDLETQNLNKKKHETQERVLEQVKKQHTATLFRHTFDTQANKTLSRARLHSTAGGYYEIFINGQKVDERVMDPGQTDFDKRILYNTDNVLNLLNTHDSKVNTQKNTIAVHLGSGWYNEFIAFSKPKRNYFLGYGQPTFIAQLELTYNDGSTQTVNTNSDWLSHPSPIIKDGIFSGELIDDNKKINNWNTNDLSSTQHWQKAHVLTQPPTQELEPQLLPAIKAVEDIKPVAITQPAPNVWVLDFGKNFTGIPTVDISQLRLEKNDAFFMRYAEWANEDGSINQRSGGGAPLLKQVDGYIASENSSKKGNSWTPIFTWHGFRYLEITGLKTAPPLSAFTGHLLRSSVERVGTFTSSDTLLNRIHDMALLSYETNLMALPMDCPIRERAGWTGDAHAALITGNYNFNMANFWEKYLVDFETSAHVAPAVVPGKRSHGGNFDWAAAEIMIAWEHYRHHGNVALLKDQYDSMTEYMQAGEAKLKDNLLRIGYGDWCDPVKVPGTPRVNGRCSPQHTSPIITSSALFAHTANTMAKISTLIDKPEQTNHYTQLFKRIRDQFNQEFYNKNTGHYGSQTADAMAIMFEITPQSLRASVAKALNNDVIKHWNGHASVGALGQTYVYRALSDYGYGDTAFNIFKAKGYPGYDYAMTVLNATTLWERKGFYNPNNPKDRKKGPGHSLNHPFHSGYDGWFYEGLGGIRPKGDNPAFQHFVLQPVFPEGLDSVDVSYKTGYGKIISQWKKTNKHVQWNFIIPNNTSAVVRLPKQADKTYTAGSYTVNISL